MDTHVVDHPLAAALLTTMRDERSDNATFRTALRQLTHMLVYEATRDADIDTFEVRTPVAVTQGTRLARPPLLVPVLRAEGHAAAESERRARPGAGQLPLEDVVERCGRAHDTDGPEHRA